MIRHIVCWKFLEKAEGSDRGENLLRARAMLQGLRESVPQVRQLEVGIDTVRGARSWDLALVATFDSRADLEAYQNHPAHVAVVAFLRAVQSDRCSVDYEMPPS